MAKKKRIKIPPYYWFISFLFSVFTFLIGLSISLIPVFNNHGTEFFGIKFSTFEISEGKGFDNEFWYPSDNTRLISVSNNAEVGLNPYLILDLKRYDPEIKIKCKEQISNNDCFKGFKISNNGIVTLEFDIKIGNVTNNNYNLCLKIVDSRIGREENFREKCYNLIMKEKPK